MKPVYLLIFIISMFCARQTSGQCTYANPIAAGDSPDPYVMYKDGFYYGCHTTGGDVRIYKSATLQNIFNGASQSVWGGKPDIWAPEFHYLNGKWYIYTCYNTGSYWMNTIVLEGNSQDPLGSYTLKSQLSALSNTIDASVWQDPADKQIYLVYSKMDGIAGQEIWMSKMSNPYTLEGSPVRLSYPMYSWEKQSGNVNEGPAFLVHGSKLHIVFSASQCHYENYCLGMLTAEIGVNYMDPASWSKSTQPVFQKFPANNVYAVGHHSCVQTPKGEWWLVYHAKNESIKNSPNTPRDARMQEFTFVDDYPVFGIPVASGDPSACPDSVNDACSRHLSYTNPVIRSNSADPGIYFHQEDGYYYVYNTNRQTSRSKDLVNWEPLANILAAPGDPEKTWAPEVFKRKADGLLYMVYTQDTRLYIARSSSPGGSFDYYAGPLLNRWSLDPHYFQDDDGKEYLYWGEGGCDGTAGIWVCELASDLKSIINPQHCFGNGNKPEAWITECVREAPQMLKQKGTYYLVYSGNGTGVNYGLGYATAPSPTGPWTINPGNPILWDGKTGPGHCSFTYSPDGKQMFVVYHQSDNSIRCTSVDRAEFVANGNNPDKLVIHYTQKNLQSYPFCPALFAVPTCTDIQMPFKKNEIPGTIEAEDFDSGCPGDAYYFTGLTSNGGNYRNTLVNIDTTEDIDGGFEVKGLTTGDWLEYTVEVLNTGFVYANIRVSAITDNNKFQIEVDGSNKSGLLSFNNTGGEQNWTTITKRLYLIAGSHTLRLYIVNSSGKLNINKLSFLLTTDTEKKKIRDEVIKIFPNPATNRITIFSGQLIVNKIQITDEAGKIVFISNEKFEGNNNIDISRFPCGIYFIQFDSEHEISHKKIIIH